MTPARLNALADRAEAATGADRELDAEIAPVAGFRVVNEGHPLGLQCYDSEHRSVRLPAYTRSIDDAMALVAPDSLITLKTLWDGPSAHGYAVVRRYEQSTEDCDGWRYTSEDAGLAPTPALALTAAALRARARAMEGE
jgi:hypothetical protein